MHLVESYALNTGVKIGKPFVYEKYAGLPFDENKFKYIVLSPFSDKSCKNYDLWEETIQILTPILNKYKIKIVQVGAPSHPRLNHVHCINGELDINKCAYLIKRAELLVVIDDICMHIASHFNKKIVSLFSSHAPSHTGAYWSDKDSIINLVGKNEFSYANEEAAKNINIIRPEKIVKSICKLLDIEYDYPFKALYVGPNYPFKKVELMPISYIANMEELGAKTAIVRMDLLYNMSSLEKQLQICSCSIVLDKPIDIEFLKKYKERIIELVFFINEDSDPDYFELLKQDGFKFNVASRLSGPELNKIKLKYLDYTTILEMPHGSKDKIKDLIKDKSNLYYKNSCLTVKGTDIYMNKSESQDNTPVNQVNFIEPRPVIDDEKFWNEIESMMILEKVS